MDKLKLSKEISLGHIFEPKQKAMSTKLENLPKGYKSQFEGIPLVNLGTI